MSMPGATGLERFRTQLEKKEIPAISSVSSLQYMNLYLGHHISFNKFEKLCEKVPNIKHLSCSVTHLSFTDGQRWENLIATCFLSLSDFHLLFQFGDPVPSHVNITNIIEKFQTRFWLDKNWYFICDYCPNTRTTLALYSIPYQSEDIAPLINTYITTSSLTMIYDKVEILFLKFSAMRHLNTQRIYPNVSTLVLLNEDDMGELMTIPLLRHHSFLTSERSLCGKT
ncbi:unnamed protein product [Didymodactylos carnosus]|uniref:Uncharacterized protein n=1 Tax=Didymodactylos carnosus TaxID=1234261 RepID=A0A8S2DG98_9BILA|nr:unnamed protein product [Didymodactylos carnosus]CAF3699602.1 unnamed protein product [Didymodactylos carnosus]